MRSEPAEVALQLKRNAVQIVGQLPEVKEEALRVLEYARQLVEWEAAPDAAAPILKIVG